jgi:ribosomal protein RSM22 (predicted rRNA methylase)
MSIPAQKLSPRFEALLRSSLAHYAPGALARELSSHIKKLSDFYLIAPGAATPWDKDYALPATLAYFMPLNGARMNSVFREAARFLPPDSISEIWDFGAGLGTTQWILEDQAWLSPRPLYSLEISPRAAKVHQELQDLNSGGRWHSEARRSASPKPGALAVFSYSFLEMQKSLPAMDTFDHWLILEPSTRECGRALMEWRQRFVTAGFEPLAPCTHSLGCPLLTHSPRDWCHQRMHFEGPDWWQEIEDFLPMKNRTLTYSYLVLSKTVRDSRWRSAARVIGDTLPEKGKTRQLICRGPEREFFSWLHKNIDPPVIPHGALVREIGTPEIKGGELRVGPVDWEV